MKLHFIYGLWSDSDEMPLVYQSNLELWRSLNPTHTIRVWNKTQIETLVNNSPNWKDLYYQTTKPIQRSDIARLLILWKKGGMYSDLDLLPKLSLDQLEVETHLASGKAIVGIEHPYRKQLVKLPLGDGRQKVQVILSDERPLGSRKRSAPGHHLPSIRQGIEERLPRISNYWLAAPPRHPFIKNCLSLISQRIHLPIKLEYDILYTTGPDILSEAFSLTSDSLLFVLDYLHFQRAFKHLATGTWRWNKKSQEDVSTIETTQNETRTQEKI